MNRYFKAIQAHYHAYQSNHFEKTLYGKKLEQLKECHQGDCCVVVGNGPSLTSEDLQRIHELNITTFATNRIFKIFDKTDWRPTYYVSEDILLMRDAQKIIEEMPVRKRFIPINLKWFEGVDIPNADYFYMEYQDTLRDTFGLSMDIPHHLRCRGTVTITCIQFAIYMGFRDIYLIGVDHNFAKMFDKDGNMVIDNTIQNHFADDYDKGIFDQGFHVDEATAAYMDVEQLSRKLGTFRIFNATRGGKLEVYKRKNLDELLAQY